MVPLVTPRNPKQLEGTMQSTDYVSEHRAAELLGVAVRTMRKRRYSGIGPAYSKCGKFVYYSRRDLEHYLDAHRHEPVREKAYAGVGAS